MVGIALDKSFVVCPPSSTRRLNYSGYRWVSKIHRDFVVSLECWAATFALEGWIVTAVRVVARYPPGQTRRHSRANTEGSSFVPVDRSFPHVVSVVLERGSSWVGDFQDSPFNRRLETLVHQNIFPVLLCAVERPTSEIHSNPGDALDQRNGTDCQCRWRSRSRDLLSGDSYRFGSSYAHSGTE